MCLYPKFIVADIFAVKVLPCRQLVVVLKTNNKRVMFNNFSTLQFFPFVPLPYHNNFFCKNPYSCYICSTFFYYGALVNQSRGTRVNKRWLIRSSHKNSGSYQLLIYIVKTNNKDFFVYLAGIGAKTTNGLPFYDYFYLIPY